MKNQTPDQKQQGGQQKNWNASKSEKDLNDKNFSSRNSGLDDDAQRDMDLSDDEDVDDMDMSSNDEFVDTDVNSPSSGRTPSQRPQDSQRDLGRDSGRESTIGATRHDGPKGSQKQ